jgi:hypothetical protein
MDVQDRHRRGLPNIRRRSLVAADLIAALDAAPIGEVQTPQKKSFDPPSMMAEANHQGQLSH